MYLEEEILCPRLDHKEACKCPQNINLDPKRVWGRGLEKLCQRGEVV